MCLSRHTHATVGHTHALIRPSRDGSRSLSLTLCGAILGTGKKVGRSSVAWPGAWELGRPRIGRTPGARGARGTSQPCGHPIVRLTCDMAAYAVVFNEISISKSDKISDIERRDVEYPITPTACAAAGRTSGEARGPVQRTRGPARGNAHTARAHALWPLRPESRNLPPWGPAHPPRFPYPAGTARSGRAE